MGLTLPKAKTSEQLQILVTRTPGDLLAWCRTGIMGVAAWALAACNPVEEMKSATMETALKDLPLPEDCSQAILARFDDWDATQGTMVLCEKKEDQWVRVVGPFPVTTGRNGLAWGAGLHSLRDSMKRKEEGDGKATAGIFALGTAFGYAPEAPEGVRWPYRQATARDFFVDDSDSGQYNSWVHLDDPAADPEALWKSFERMKREDGLYELGLVVRHNMDPAEPNMGSAIFLHIWGGPEETTSGCTAMAKAHLEELLQWLTPDRSPVLVQLPDSAFPEFLTSDSSTDSEQ